MVEGHEDNVSNEESTQNTEMPGDLEALKVSLEEERGKAQGYLANWQRAQADFINYKRRMEQEKMEGQKTASAMIIYQLLPIVDDLDRALESVDTKLAGLTWIDGLRLVQRKLQALFESYGVKQIKTVGQDFNPALHEAVMHGEGDDGKVLAEFQKGYMLGDQVLRPAIVKVGSGKAKETEEKEAS